MLKTKVLNIYISFTVLLFNVIIAIYFKTMFIHYYTLTDEENYSYF